MTEVLIRRKEHDLPPEVRALLHATPDEPLPPGVWHLPSHPRINRPFRAAAAISLALLLITVSLFAVVAGEAFGQGQFRGEGLIITGSMVLFAAVLYGLCRWANNKTLRREAEGHIGRTRWGLWLTPQHVLVHDNDEGIRCVRKQDVTTTHIYASGRPPLDLLVLTLTNGHPIRIAVDSLDGWRGRASQLRQEVVARLGENPATNVGISLEQVKKIATYYLPHQQFSYFVRELNQEAQRLQYGANEKTALLALAEQALMQVDWPGASRYAMDDWFMWTETVNDDCSESDTRFLGFKKAEALWLLPLCRAVSFHEAENIFPTVDSVRDCATTLQAVPLTLIEFNGGMADDVFDAFLTWVATKQPVTVRANDYKPARNRLSDLRPHLRARLEALQVKHR